MAEMVNEVEAAMADMAQRLRWSYCRKGFGLNPLDFDSMYTTTTHKTLRVHAAVRIYAMDGR